MPVNDKWTKEDLRFLATRMDYKFEDNMMFVTSAGGLDDNEENNDKIQNQAMSTPKPLTIDVQGNMTADDYIKCSFVMATCQSMIHNILVDIAKASNIPERDALKNMDAWVKAYVEFPFPFFNFVDTQSDVFQKENFNVKTDAELIEKAVNIKGIPNLKEAVIGAVKAASANLPSHSEQDRNFNYLGIVTGYNATNISTRVIKYQMNMKKTKVDSLCVHYTDTAVDTRYDTYQFVADKEMMIRMYAKTGDKPVDYLAAKLLNFLQNFYDTQFTKFTDQLRNVIKSAK